MSASSTESARYSVKSLPLGFGVAVLVDTLSEGRSKQQRCNLLRELLIRFLGNRPHGFGSLERAGLAHYYRH